MRFLIPVIVAVLMSFGAVAQEASWRVTETGVEENGLRALEGADGATAFAARGGSRCITNKEDSEPPSVFLYFDVSEAFSAGPVYVVVEYFDEMLGGAISVQYDGGIESIYRESERRWGGRLMGAKQWRRGVFLFEEAAFGNRQNLGADFRFGNAALHIRSVRVTATQPADCEEIEREDHEGLGRMVKIGRGGQLIIGGFDPVSAAHGETMRQSLEEAMPFFKAIGVTSHEGYVRWNLCEPEPGRYDWSIYDAYAALYKKYGIQWVPFLIVGSPYSLPDWFYTNDAERQGYVCLEHGEESDVQSLWNPALRGHVSRFIQAFLEHYGPQGVIESVLLGITGNYGEAIYVATGNDWTADVHGLYHTHEGFWAGDPYAVADFRAWLEEKYGEVAKLNAAWSTALADFDAISPFLREQAPNDRAWVDFCDWYIGAMTAWARFWMEETRRHFPKGDIYLCTGGHAPPEHGANFGDQCKIAEAVGGGVRITNEASDYRANYSLTRWVASAGRQYGAYYSFEPAGNVNPEGVIARVYNATASGARGLHYYYGNLFGNDAAMKNFVKWGSEFKQRRPVVEIAVYYPQTHIKLNGNDFLGRVQRLRDFFDFDYLSDEQIRDGGLETHRALILLHGSVSEADVWGRVAEWVREGGLLFYASEIGRLHSVEGEDMQDRVLGARGKGRVLTFSGRADSLRYGRFLARELASAPELSKSARAMVAADGVEDRVFVTQAGRGELLWFNAKDKEVRKGVVVLAPYSIKETRVR